MADTKAKAGGLLKEFKEFAMRGNVIDLAIGVVIGAAFGKVVTAVVDIFLTPILAALVPKVESASDGFVSGLINFVGVAIEFLVTALVLFAIVKVVNKFKKKEAPAPAPAPRLCPYCKGEIAKDATRCPHCTSVFDPVTSTKK